MAQTPNEITTPITEAVSEALERPVETLPPLSKAIDIGGLDNLITDKPDHDVTVTFAYAGLRVVAHSNKTVYVHPIQNAGTDPKNKLSDTNQ